MGFIGGDLRESFIGKVKGTDPGRLLAVPIDVGKNSAAAMVCDFWGVIIAPPFVFKLNERGVVRIFFQTQDAFAKGFRIARELKLLSIFRFEFVGFQSVVE